VNGKERFEGGKITQNTGKRVRKSQRGSGGEYGIVRVRRKKKKRWRGWLIEKKKRSLGHDREKTYKK